MLGYLLDAAIIGVFVMYIVKNRKTTQLRCALETLCYVAAVILAIPIAIKVSELSYNTFFRMAIADKITATVETIASVESHMSGFERILRQMPSMVRNAADSYGVTSPENMAAVEKLLSSSRNTSALEITDLIGKPVIEGVFRAVFFIIFFIALLFLAKGLAATLENLLYTQDRVQVNTSLGGVFGAFKAGVVVLFTITVLQFVIPALPVISFLNVDTFNQSFIFKLFYHNNIVMLFLGNGIYPVSM